MKRTACMLTAAVIALLVLVVATPCPVLAAEFSADLIRSGGNDRVTSKVFIKGDLRREEVMEDGEVGAATIIRPDKGVTWNLMPEDKMYMETPLQSGMTGAQEGIKSLESSAIMRSLGKETLNGYVCEKRRYDPNDKTQGSVIVWYSPKLDHPVKVQIMAYGSEADMVLEYKKIKPGKIPDSKFEIPEGYEKFAIPGMPAGMPGGMPDIPGMGK